MQLVKPCRSSFDAVGPPLSGSIWGRRSGRTSPPGRSVAFQGVLLRSLLRGVFRWGLSARTMRHARSRQRNNVLDVRFVQQWGKARQAFIGNRLASPHAAGSDDPAEVHVELKIGPCRRGGSLSPAQHGDPRPGRGGSHRGPPGSRQRRWSKGEKMLTVVKSSDRRGSAPAFSHLFANQPRTRERRRARAAAAGGWDSTETARGRWGTSPPAR